MPRAQHRTEYEVQGRLNGADSWVPLVHAIDIAAARVDLERIVKEQPLPRSRVRVVKRVISEEVVIWAGAD
jgi:hypothetical protein